MQVVNSQNLSADFFTFQDFEGTESVVEIIKDVKKRGDEAVVEYSQKFGDGCITALELTQEEIENAVNSLPEDVLEAIKTSVVNVKAFAQEQFASIKNVEVTLNDAVLGHSIVPLERTGAYVPGGNYPLPSSAIMSVVPAKVAGVKEVIVCSPKIKPETIAAASLAGADRIFRVGGVQAIAAMAYGTQSIPKVDKITGPGNKYVTAAKKEVYGVCGIDFLAGPSEVMIIADESAKPDFIAADMLAQCEHDPDARAYLVTNSTKLIEQVEENIKKFLPQLKTADIAQKSIEKSIAIVVKDFDEAVKIANRKAPEHLEICFDGAKERMLEFKNYGSLFIGNYSAEVLGDYCSGTNHVLPTNGTARYSGGLSVFDFIKIQTYQQVQKGSILFATASKLAEIEGLEAHKLSADLRFNKRM